MYSPPHNLDIMIIIITLPWYTVVILCKEREKWRKCEVSSSPAVFFFFRLPWLLRYLTSHHFFFNRVNFFFNINVLPVRGRPGKRILGLFYCFRCRKSEHILATTGGATIIHHVNLFVCLFSKVKRRRENVCLFIYSYGFLICVLSCLPLLLFCRYQKVNISPVLLCDMENFGNHLSLLLFWLSLQFHFDIVWWWS